MSAARGPAARAAVSACSNAARATPRRALHSAAAPSPSSSSSSASPSLPPQASSSKQRAQDEAYDAMLKKVQQRRAERHTADVFTKLGSTQNRDTTFQPHHSLHRPPAPPAVTTSHLVAAGAHLGHSPANTHRAALPLVYGTRTGVSYIDLRQTLPALRRAAQVVKGVVERDGRVLFVGSLKGAERAVWDNAKRLGDNGFGVTKWLPGTISNAREVFGWCEIPGTGTGAPGEREQRATPLAFKPDLLVLLSPTLNRHALREATANEIPTIGIIDTDLDPRSVTYAIPANDDSPRAVELIAGVLGMAGKDGLRAKQDRLQREAAVAARRVRSERTRDFREF
ncbi:ribosomal protein [Rhodotorula diobovata]|uniref:Ribosomal protein n=1 Tax=Rhodotorula diobovata TaxID=5288 RepID=A0A5C5FW90_9BASI|nr:ribosomal protein [Rhodotorula diobovata]